jgi:Holliday junction DNA helicase RuvB
MNRTANTDPLRPTTLAEFGGQPALRGELEVLLAAARQRNQMPDHVLLSGPPGTGKTTLAAIIAAELDVALVTTSAPAIERPGDIAALLSGLRGPHVVFIDEIHRLDRRAEELLYSAMEDGVLDLVIGEGAAARSVRIPIAPFTLVGATTMSGLLSGPLRDRFGFLGRFVLYEIEDLARIVQRSATLLGVELDDDAAILIAGRSRGTPRVANRLLRRVRDWVQVNGSDGATQTTPAPMTIDAPLALAALESLGVDTLGLDALGRDIVLALIAQFRGGPVGLGALAAAVGEAPATIELVYEPHLMRAGLIARTPRGRVALAPAYQHLGLDVPETNGTLFDAPTS